MKQITVTYFAELRERAGLDSETISTDSDSLSELYLELKSKYAFPLEPSVTQVARNDEFSSMDAGFEDGDKIVFIPPVAGG